MTRAGALYFDLPIASLRASLALIYAPDAGRALLRQGPLAGARPGRE